MKRKVRLLISKLIIKNLRLKKFFDPILYINGPEKLPPPLSAEEEKEVFDLISSDPDKAKTTLIEHNLRLVVYISKKFENTGIHIEDLISIGTIGLIKAVNTFRPEKNIKLATYASRCIENEILMYLRKNSNSKMEVSLEEPLNIDWDGNELLLSDVLGSDSDTVVKNIESEIELSALRNAIRGLSEREREIMILRFGLGTNREYTQKEVADILNISQSYISRLEKKILIKLKKELEHIV
ncbi:MAG: RNA polymerase sporulation sigma factor SigE [Clostridiales bacterium]|nr:RNA polymerase sporulation sigma factor SigE [Clostridiales bacterium]